MTTQYSPPDSKNLVFRFVNNNYTTIPGTVSSGFYKGTFNYSGPGHLTGTIVKDGVGVPGKIYVTLHRPEFDNYANKEVIKTVDSDVNGLWTVTGLSTDYDFDVIAEVSTLNSKIFSKVRAVTP